jgi:alpha-galactosidase
MLEVGNPGLTSAESRAHFSLWCMLAAPLIAGNDVRSMSGEARAVLTNRDMIAIDQDPLGHEGFRYVALKDREIWAKELSNKEWAVCLLNTGDQPADFTIHWGDLTFLTGAYYKVTDVWAARTLAGNSSTPWAGTVASHGVAVLRLKPGY